MSWCVPRRTISRHPAFQLGRATPYVRISRGRPQGAPVGLMAAYRHLLSLPHPFASVWFGLPWRTFTLSWPLQPGIWLLRRRRPPLRALAVSRPGARAERCGSSPVPIGDVFAIRSCPLYTGCAVEQSWAAPSDRQAGIFPFGSGVSASFAWLHLRHFRRGFLSSA